MTAAMNRFGKFSVNLDELEAKARHVRKEYPDRFTVKKLAQELRCSNHNSSRVYFRILRGLR